MTEFRWVLPMRAAAWEAGSTAPIYASVSTITPSTPTPSRVDRNRQPRRSRATSAVFRRKNLRGRIFESPLEGEERHAHGVTLLEEEWSGPPAAVPIFPSPRELRASPPSREILLGFRSAGPAPPPGSPAGPAPRLGSPLFRTFVLGFPLRPLAPPTQISLPALQELVHPARTDHRPQAVRLIMKDLEEPGTELFHQAFGRLASDPLIGIRQVPDQGRTVGGQAQSPDVERPTRR